MTHVTPVFSNSQKNKMKKNVSGPRTETLMLIRQFARVYQYQPEQPRETKKVLVN
jgi:hypothetical protein